MPHLRLNYPSVQQVTNPVNLIPENRRVLTIDDNPSIHEDYRKVLGAAQRSLSNSDELDSAAAAFFGDEDEPRKKKVAFGGEGFDIDSAFQGQQGLEKVKKSIDNDQPYSVAFIDVRMPPGWNGIETAQKIWEVDPDLPIVLCTAYTDYSWDEISEQLNRSEQLLILKKPFDNLELRQLAHAQSERRRLATMANLKQEELERLVEQRTMEMKKTRGLVFFSLANLAESRDKSTGEHLERIQVYTGLLGTWLANNGPYQDQLTEKLAQKISISSLLHDIGKVGVSDQILLKPGRLTPDEFNEMKQHVSVGADALDQAMQYSSCCGFLKLAAEIARYHHERFDGTGYLEGLRGQDIPLSARIVAVADVFDALTSQRPYKSTIDPEDAREIILSESGRHFDPVVVQAFQSCWAEFHEHSLSVHQSKVRQAENQSNFKTV